MNAASEEQQRIINCIKEKKNVVVNACAGSGKSNTVLSCAIQLPDYHFLQITYNKTLRQEVRETVKQLELTNIEVQTFHSLAYRYYGKEGQTDEGIRFFVTEKKMPILPPPIYHVVVIDEAQDMTILYKDFLSRFLLFQKDILLLVLGDEKQGLYEFKGADIRFLTKASEIWKDHPSLLSSHFERGTLLTSYRITIPICQFVNDVLLDSTNRIIAIKEGPKVQYIRRNYSSTISTIIGNILKLIEQGAKYDEFFILGGSVKENSFLRKIENGLAEKHIPCYVPTLDAPEELDPRIMKNKITFSTFHTSKGRQRKYVFIHGFDSSYFLYNAKDLPIDICPNTIYVGCTRASEKLYVYENSDVRPFEFLRMSHIDMLKSDFITFSGPPCVQFPVSEEKQEKKKTYTTPTELLRFMSEDVYQTITPMVNKIFEVIQLKGDEINLPNIYETKNGYFEDVSDINGIVIPLWVYQQMGISENNVLQKLILQSIQDMKKEHPFLTQLVNNMPPSCDSIQDYLYVTNLFISIQEKLYSKIKQIPLEECQWLSLKTLEISLERMKYALRNESGPFKIETTLIRYSEDEQHIYIDEALSNVLPPSRVLRFTARTDFDSESSIWEMKCTSHISIEHKLQLIIYLWLYHMTLPISLRETKKKTGYLFNIKTNECFRCNGSLQEWTEIIQNIVKAKTGNQNLSHIMKNIPGM